MCGIAGIVGSSPEDRIDPSRVGRMCESIRHRGPDDGGVWTEGPAGLGSRRLAIVDVARGRQPMASADGNLVVAYNGEIYNHPELRVELESRGRRYRTRSDTETVLHVYDEWGDEGLHRLRGMFGFSLWDRSRRRLLLARDRLGIKPLYYAWTGRELVFASEIKAILASGAIRPELNRSVLPEYLATGFVTGEQTFFEGVKKLLPGCLLTFEPGGAPSVRRWWRFSPSPGRTTGNLASEAELLRELLRESVHCHLMSDVPLGVFLSGGLDSTGLAALTSRLVSEPIHTFSVGFEDRGTSELDYARLAAEAIGSRHRDVTVRAEDFFRALPRLVWHEDEPIAFPSSVPLYFVSRLASEDVKVVLTGEGADELFLGYNRYRLTAWNRKLGRSYEAVVPELLRRGLRRAVPRLPKPLRRYAERTFLGRGPGVRDLVFDNFAVFSQAAQSAILRERSLLDANDPYARVEERWREADGDDLTRMWRTDLDGYLVELLMKQDQMSMAASIESRVPFLDHRLVEHAASLPSHLKLRGFQTKSVLRKALHDIVPREILTRRKMGFPVPIGRWFRGDFAPLVEELVTGDRARKRDHFEPDVLRRLVDDHRRGAANHGDRLWLLANLEIWQRVFLDGEAVESAVPEMQRATARVA